MTVKITEWSDAAGNRFPKLEASGKDLTEAFQQAARGFYSLFTDLAQVRPLQKVAILCESSDTDWLFSDWINTLLYETRERGMLFSEFHVEVDGINVEGYVLGEKIDANRHLLKRDFIAGAAFESLSAVEEDVKRGEPARVGVVLNDLRQHPLPLKELWEG